MSDPTPNDVPPAGQLLIYQDGVTRLQVRLDGQTVWLTQAQLAELYQTSKQNISLHLQNIFDEGELRPEATVKDYLTVQTEGNRRVKRAISHYNLDAILAIGYRVRSPRGTAFRQWATARLSELLVKGFTLDDDRIKAGTTIGADYFDELLDPTREICGQPNSATWAHVAVPTLRGFSRLFVAPNPQSLPPSASTRPRPRLLPQTGQDAQKPSPRILRTFV